VEKLIVVHIADEDFKIVVETSNGTAALKLIDQGSVLGLNGLGAKIYAEELDMADVGRLPFTVASPHVSGQDDMADIRQHKGKKRLLGANRPGEKTAESGTLETLVTGIIYKMGVPANLKGYGFLREAIILSVKNPNIISAVTKELYPAVAEVFGTTGSRVERAVRHAITVAWQRMDSRIMKEYFGYRMSFSADKPSNSEFIATITDRLLLRLNGT
jgi:hypothetical protein